MGVVGDMVISKERIQRFQNIVFHRQMVSLFLDVKKRKVKLRSGCNLTAPPLGYVKLIGSGCMRKVQAITGIRYGDDAIAIFWP